MTPAVILLLVAGQALFPIPAAASDLTPPSAAGSPSLPSDDELEAGGAVIGDVRIVVGDIFDPADPEDRLPGSRLVNRLHPTTRQQVIARQLLFRPGDRYVRRLLDESERLLRADRYFRDVVVRPVAYDGQRVAIEVAARDVWTLSPGLSFGRAGGASSMSVELQDTNFLGTGRQVVLEHRQDVDRTATRLGFTDPALLGSRFQLSIDYRRASDGGGWNAEIERAFFSLDSHWAAALEGSVDERIDSLYRLGRVSSQFHHEAARFELRGGLSEGLSAGRVTRWTAGLTYQSDRFAALRGSSAPPPPDRTLAYPWIGWDRQRDAYEETRNLDQIGRTEDVHVGPQLHAKIGFASPELGADRTALLFDGTAGLVLAPRSGRLLRLEAGTTGRLEHGRLAHTLLHGGAQAYWRNQGRRELYVGLAGDVARALDPEQQITLGGDNGLRGYPLRYQAGDARLLLTVEQRIFTDWYPLHLARVGAAVFYDVGRTWGGFAEARRGLLQDIGAGLRLAPTRTGHGSMIHLDVAFPLDGSGDLEGVQWLVRSHSTF